MRASTTAPAFARPARARRASPKSRANAGVDVPTLLNNVPHARATRRWFYEDATKSIVAAVTARERRIKIKSEFPELNVNGDVYRVGTTLELVRETAAALARDGLRVNFERRRRRRTRRRWRRIYRERRRCPRRRR